MYLTFDEYIQFGGTITDEATFNDLEFRAETLIDWYTFNRLQNDTEIPKRVKQCMYTIIKYIYDEMVASALPSVSGESQSGVHAGIASQSNDGVSISYNVLSATEIVNNAKEEIKNMVMMGLQGVVNSAGKRLTWRGIYPDE